MILNIIHALFLWHDCYNIQTRIKLFDDHPNPKTQEIFLKRSGNPQLA